MKIAIMQPYTFPYIGYFQMISAVDKFVFYDDVNYIKQGWINRNKILLNNKEYLFTIPLEKATSFSLIKDTKIDSKQYESWKINFLKTLRQNYKKAPYFIAIYDLCICTLDSNCISISEVAIKSVMLASKYLNLKTEFVISSEQNADKELGRMERLIEICKKENANFYINGLGGLHLYKKDEFAKKDVHLHFIKSKPIKYKQFNNEFIPWLSILDVLMFNSPEEIKMMLDKYELL